MVMPIRYPNGVSTQAPGQSLADLPIPSPTNTHAVMEDFTRYAATEWNVRATTTNSLAALATSPFGVLSLTAPGSLATSQVAALESNPPSVLFTSVQKVWFETRFALTNVTTSTLLTGLTAGTTAVLATPPTDGIWFTKAANSTSIILNSRVASGTTVQTTVPVATGLLANSTFIRLGFYYNGKDSIDIFVNGSKVASQTTLTGLPVSTLLSRTVGTSNGATATAAELLVDYVFAAQDRTAI